MGFFDFIMSFFGGGAKMAIKLDVERVPVGGILSGTATLKGAPKDCVADTVKVQLIYVNVETQEDSALPKIDTRILVDQVIANNVELPAESEKEFSFTVSIPGGTKPTAHNSSYKVKVVSDIKGMKDPSATMDLKVFEGEGGADAPGLTAEGLYKRWPALRGTEKDPLLQALRDMRWKHDKDEPDNDLRVAEPILLKHIRGTDQELSMAAFDTWTKVVSDNLRTEHLDVMREMAARVKDRPEDLASVLRDMGPTMDLGGDRVALEYIEHADTSVRLAAIATLGWGQGNKKRAKLVFPCLKDPNAEIRAQALSTLSDYKDDPEIVDAIIALAMTDESPDVLDKAIGGLALCWTNKNVDKVRPVYERARTHESAKVRRSYVHWIGWPARVDDVTDHIRALLRDPDKEVAEGMAFEFNNLLRDNKQYTPLCKEAASDDSLPLGVRGNALGALPSGLPVEEVVAYYRKLVDNDAPEEIQDHIVRGLKFEAEKHDAYMQLLRDMTNSKYTAVAARARRYL